MKKFVIVLGFLLAFAACDKKQDEIVDLLPCEFGNFGYVTVYNKSINPYILYIDGDQITRMQGYTSYEAVGSPGVRNFKLVQDAGYFIVPTVYEQAIDLDRCDELSWKP